MPQHHCGGVSGTASAHKLVVLARLGGMSVLAAARRGGSVAEAPPGRQVEDEEEVVESRHLASPVVAL